MYRSQHTMTYQICSKQLFKLKMGDLWYQFSWDHVLSRYHSQIGQSIEIIVLTFLTYTITGFTRKVINGLNYLYKTLRFQNWHCSVCHTTILLLTWFILFAHIWYDCFSLERLHNPFLTPASSIFATTFSFVSSVELDIRQSGPIGKLAHILFFKRGKMRIDMWNFRVIWAPWLARIFNTNSDNILSAFVLRFLSAITIQASWIFSTIFHKFFGVKTYKWRRK